MQVLHVCFKKYSRKAILISYLSKMADGKICKSLCCCQLFHSHISDLQLPSFVPLFCVVGHKEWWCWQNIVHTTLTLWWNFLTATGGPYESAPNPANPDRNKIMKVAPSDVCFPAQMQREGTVLKINQSSVMFLAGWGSLGVKLKTSIVFCPMRPQVESQWKGDLAA